VRGRRGEASEGVGGTGRRIPGKGGGRSCGTARGCCEEHYSVGASPLKYRPAHEEAGVASPLCCATREGSSGFSRSSARN